MLLSGPAEMSQALEFDRTLLQNGHSSRTRWGGRETKLLQDLGLSAAPKGSVEMACRGR